MIKFSPIFYRAAESGVFWYCYYDSALHLSFFVFLFYVGFILLVSNSLYCFESVLVVVILFYFCELPLWHSSYHNVQEISA